MHEDEEPIVVGDIYFSDIEEQFTNEELKNGYEKEDIQDMIDDDADYEGGQQGDREVHGQLQPESKENVQKKGHPAYMENIVKFEQNDLQQPVQKSQPMPLPRFSQIQRGIQVFRQILPDQFNQKVINHLYEKIMTVYQQNLQSQPQLNPTTSLQTSLAESAVSLFPISGNLPEGNTSSEFNRQRIPQVGNRQNGLQFPSQQLFPQNIQAQRPAIRKIIAQCFCERGFGLQLLKQYTSERNWKVDINQVQYEAMMRQIVKSTANAIEQFLIGQCKLTIPKLASPSTERHLMQIMFNCRVYFSGDICQIVYNIIRNICEVSKAQVTDTETMQLYNSLKGKMQADLNSINEASQNARRNQGQRQRPQPQSRSMVQNRMGMGIGPQIDNRGPRLPAVKYREDDVRNRIPYQLTRIWRDVHEAQLLQMCRKQMSNAQMRDAFKTQYPREADFFSVPALRSQLTRIVRGGVRKLYYYINKYGSTNLPKLEQLHDNKMKIIIHNTIGRRARNMLIEIYAARGYDEKMVVSTINTITECLKEDSQNNPSEPPKPILKDKDDQLIKKIRKEIDNYSE